MVEKTYREDKIKPLSSEVTAVIIFITLIFGFLFSFAVAPHVSGQIEETIVGLSIGILLNVMVTVATVGVHYYMELR